MSLAKILWVDDEIESLQSQKLFLENKGYDVQTLTNGFDAIDYIKENIVDVVLIDETMPGITGLEVVEGVRDRDTEVAVIMFTAYTGDLEAQGRRLGFTVLRKPLDIEGLRRAVRDALVARGTLAG